MKLKASAGYEDAWKKERDIPEDSEMRGYVLAIIDFAEQWANEMEKRILEGEGKCSVESCAEDSMNLVDSRPGFGITGNQYAHAVRVLAHYWILGEPLRRRHNKKYNHNGEGVVNPAILHVSACSSE